MNKVSSTYKITSILLLAIIISHLFVFHFELEEKVLCIGDEGHFHIESISELCSQNLQTLNHLNSKSKISANHNCTDYFLDNHVDEDYAKIRNNKIHRSFYTLTYNNKELNKSNASKNKNFSQYIIPKYIDEQLPTVLLLI